MAKDNHHHGNLRETLIEAAIAILAEEGSEGLTLRRAAARAGVSHAAPAHHFAGLPGLLTATATRAFSLFTEEMIRARDASPANRIDRLLGIATGYQNFARQHRGLFHLMFNSPTVCRDDPDLMAASAKAYYVLRVGCAPFGQEDPTKLEMVVWSMVHGFSALQPSPAEIHAASGKVSPDFEELLRPILEML